ncbi:MAG: calcium/sodium antiporter [Rhodobacteraceae bacterium]|nr:calcium/sodium antiporter [Paracoccaceae bacterium]
MWEWGGATLGLVILLLSGDALVRGAVNLSLRLGMAPLIVSLIVVGFGTSAPELLVAISALYDDAPQIALGNVIGSNIANILLVLGVPALLSNLHTSEFDSRRCYVLMIIASVVFTGLAFGGQFTWMSGLVMLAVLAGILYDSLRAALRHPERRAPRALIEGCDVKEQIDGADPDMPWWKLIGFLLLGMVGLPLGADVLVDNAVGIASRLMVSETVIGLTLIALGTSLPELATTTMAALRRQADIALGNVLGSNIFNLLGIIGIASLIGTIPVDAAILRFDLWVMLTTSVLLIPFVFFKRNVTFPWGVALSSFYVIYIIAVFF